MRNMMRAMGSVVQSSRGAVQGDEDGRGGERLRVEARAEVVQEAADQKHQGLEQFEGVVEVGGFFVNGFERRGFERAVDGAAGQFLHPDSARAEAFGDAVGGEFREVAEGADAPEVQRFEEIGIGRQGVDGQDAEDALFLAGADDGDAGEIAGGEDGGFNGRGDGDARDSVDLAHLARGDGEDGGLGVDHLHFGRESLGERGGVGLVDAGVHN
jgi:hypothetical protein